MFRALRVIIGYVLLLIGGVVWFICFPMSAYTLYVSGEFPLDYFGVHVYLGFPLDFFLPPNLWKEPITRLPIGRDAMRWGGTWIDGWRRTFHCLDLN